MNQSKIGTYYGENIEYLTREKMIELISLITKENTELKNKVNKLISVTDGLTLLKIEL